MVPTLGAGFRGTVVRHSSQEISHPHLLRVAAINQYLFAAIL